MTNWNVLTDAWMDVCGSDGLAKTLSPTDVLAQAGELRAIQASSPLDVFSAHRFLLTLLYWKASEAGGIEALRSQLLAGTVPRSVLDAFEHEKDSFWLYDEKRPFLQSPELATEKKKDAIGYFFTELATGTNVSHFHHGDDARLRLCLRCLSKGFARVVPWTQSGGSGKTPAIHNAPPIQLLAMGKSVGEILGLNLVSFPDDVPLGEPTWTGTFRPTDCGKPADQWSPVAVMEALTWNPRRILLGVPETGHDCWRCGASGSDVATANRMIFAKNEYTKKPPNAWSGFNFPWRDPAAFYPVAGEEATPAEKKQAFTTRKSAKEFLAFPERDLRVLGDPEQPVTNLVQQANPDHDDWLLIVPCTDAANNKSFDVRCVHLSELTADAFDQVRCQLRGAYTRDALRGWRIPANPRPVSWAFLQETARYGAVDWGILAGAANQTMNQAPEAFDLFSGLYWSLRDRRRALPRREVLWLVLKLMATTPPSYRTVQSGGGFNPLWKIPQLQEKPPQDRKSNVLKQHPRALPRGVELESQLRESIRKHLAGQQPAAIAWADLCDQLNELL